MLIKHSDYRLNKKICQIYPYFCRRPRCRKLIDFSGGLFDHVRWIRSWSIYNTSFEDRFSTIHQEHLGIIKAIEKRDPNLAEKRMRAHIEGLVHRLELNEDFPK